MGKYRRILKYASRHRPSFILIFFLTVAASALTALQPWPMKLLVDHVLLPEPVPPLIKSTLNLFGLKPAARVFLLLGTLGGLVLFALNSVLEIALVRAWTVAGRRMVYDLAEDLFTRLQHRSLLFHGRSSVGDAMSRITKDSWCVHQVLDTLCFAPGHAILNMAGMLLMMASLDATLTLLSLLIAPFMVGASFLVGQPLRAAGKLKREIESRIQSHVQQTLTGVPVVQAFGQEDREQERFEKYADAAIAVQQRSTLIGSLNSLSSGLITTLGTGVILWVGASHYLSLRLTIGSLLLFLFYLSSLQAQMKILANVHTSLQGFNASVDRVIEVLDAEPEVADRPGAIELLIDESGLKSALPSATERGIYPAGMSAPQARAGKSQPAFANQPSATAESARIAGTPPSSPSPHDEGVGRGAALSSERSRSSSSQPSPPPEGREGVALPDTFRSGGLASRLTRCLVQFDHLTFGYETGQPVLHDISFQAHVGQTLAIVGPTGAGKSTLVNLIPRFFDPWEGRVLLDGHNLRDIRLKSLRAQVGLVLQEPFLFPFSIADNIAFGRPEAPRSEIEAAARAANAHDFIVRLPQGYETMLGERGGTLSGGERQRLSIARALLKNAPILILDEPTSALDAQTEALLLEALERLMEGRTTFIIAHRLSTIRRASLILVLRDGRIEESGTHEQLLAHGQLYARLHALQFGGGAVARGP